MVLYFSGTGNSAYAAKRISRETGDRCISLFEKIRRSDFSAMHAERPWVIVAPTYAWRIPRLVQNWIERTALNGSRDVYFVLTCGENICGAGEYLKKLCAKKKMNYMGCREIVMPENYIAMFTTPDAAQAAKILERAEHAIDRTALYIKNGEKFPPMSVSLMDRVYSGVINDLFYPTCVHARKFHVTDSCISCGKCAAVCPLGNVRIEQGKPVWGKNCTHCMACICRCPKEAIEYGKHSRGLARYTCQKDI